MECFAPERRSFRADVHARALKGEHFSFGDHYGQEGLSVDVEVSVNPVLRCSMRKALSGMSSISLQTSVTEEIRKNSGKRAAGA